MPVDPPFNVYRDQLTSQYHGLALWNPNPPKTIYNHVSIGDVGYVHEGVFIRMFNVILPWDHESNRTLGEPEPYESLDCGPFTKVLDVPLKTQEHYSRYVSIEKNDSNAQANVPDDAEGVTYNCRGHGALLFLPQGGRRADIIHTKVFEDYIRDHVVSWFTWAQKNRQGVERMEDLVLVSGCTLAPSWAAAAFVYNTMEAKISLARRTLSNGRECFAWGNIRGAVEYHDSDINPQNPPTTPDQCVFIRGFRAKRVLFWTKPMRAAAEPRPDDPDNRRDDEIQVTRVPDGPKYRDPLIAILDHIVERCSNDAQAEDIIAIAHDDDLQLIKDVEILTADAIEEFLREKQMPLLVENGAAILRDSPRIRQVTVERHEGQSQKETCSPPSRLLVKAASMPLLANRQSHTPQFGSLLASRTSQTTPERHGDCSQEETRLPSPRRLSTAASMSLLGNRPQFGSLLDSVTSQMTAGRDEGQLQQETRPPSFRRLAKAASMSALGDRKSATTQFGSLLASGRSQMTAEILEGQLQTEQQQRSSQLGITWVFPSHATSSSSSLGSDALAQRKEILDAWIDAEGEIPVLNKDDGSWTLIHSGMLACKDSAGKNSWRDGHCALLESHLLFLEDETSPSGPTRGSHIFRPIPLECLRLASFDDKPEVRKHHLGLLKRDGSYFRLSPTKQQIYPFTIYHAAAKITRRYTLYAKSEAERNRWNVALESAIKARKSQDGRTSYEPNVLIDGFFKVPPRIQFNRGTHYTGRIICAAPFSFEGEDYVAVGCTSGIYLSKHAVDYSFQRVLEFNEPTSVVAIPEFNKLVVHCESALFSYSLELAIRVSQGDASSKPGLDNSAEKLAQEHGNILFFKVGRIAGRTLMVYASKASKEVTLRTFELTHQGEGPQTSADPGPSYRPSGSPIPIPEEPHDATFFDDKVAICTPKAIYMMEPMNAANSCHKVVLELSNSEHDADAFRRLLKRTTMKLGLGKNNTPRILDLVGKASILGVMTRENNMFVVYNDLGCLVDQAGRPADSNYYIEWECKATAFARRGPHLLLFSPAYIEVRNIDTGKLVRMIGVNELRLLCSSLTDWLMPMATVATKDSDGGHTEKLVELGY